MVPVRRVLAVAVGRIGPDKLAHLPARLERGAHLAGDVLCVKVVEDRPEGGHIALLGGRVDAVVHRDVADAPLGKIPLEVVARQDVVAPETGEVLGEHRVDPARLDVLHHAQEARPVEVRPRVAVVRVDFHDGQAVFPAVVQQEIPLVPDALGGAVPVAVLLGKAQVERRARRAHGPLRSRSSICPPPAPIYAARRRTMRGAGRGKTAAKAAVSCSGMRGRRFRRPSAKARSGPPASNRHRSGSGPSRPFSPHTAPGRPRGRAHRTGCRFPARGRCPC